MITETYTYSYHPEVSDGRRAFLMGNALVCGIVQEIGRSLYRFIYDEAPVSTHPIQKCQMPDALFSWATP